MNGMTPRAQTVRRQFGDVDLELCANDVLRALGEDSITREDAIRVARAVLEGFGHIYGDKSKPTRRKLKRVAIFPGKEPTIGLRRPE